MSSLQPTSPGSLSLAELERTFGVLFVGYVFAMTLYGFTFFQSYMYFLRYPHDTSLVKYTVGILCALDTTIAGLMSYSLYHYLVDLFPFVQGLDLATDEFCTQFLLSTVVVVVCQLFYAQKIYHFSKSLLIPSAISILSGAGFVLGLAASGKLINNRAFVDLGHVSTHAINSAAQGAVAMAALLTFVTLTILLHPSRNANYKPFPTWWDACVAVAISRGGTATIVQFGYFIVFAAAPSRAYWMPFHLTATKLFVVGLLTLLNSRETVDGHGVDAGDSVSTGISKPSGTFITSPGGHSNIRFNVVDTNPTINVEVTRTTQSDHRAKPELYFEEDFSLDQRAGDKKIHEGLI